MRIQAAATTPAGDCSRRFAFAQDVSVGSISKSDDCLVDAEEHPPLRVTGNVSEAEVRVESSRTLVDGIDGDEPRSHLGASAGSSLDRLDEEVPAKALSLVRFVDRKSRQQDHADFNLGQSSTVSRRKLFATNAAHGQRVVASDVIVVVDQEERAREVAPLILDGMVTQPDIELCDTTGESVQIERGVESLDPHLVGSLEPPGLPSLLDE